LGRRELSLPWPQIFLGVLKKEEEEEECTIFNIQRFFT
jgi:hypothetical protein